MSILSDVFDEARGVFKDFLDFERFKAELQLAKDARAAQRQQARQDAPVITSHLLGSPVVMLGVAGIAGVLLWRALK